MKVLLITHQLIDDRNEGYWCNFALYGTIENMSVIGEMYILGNKYFKTAAQPITEHLSFIKPGHVGFLLPTSKNIRQYLKNRRINRKTIEQMVRGKDLIIGYAPSGAAEYAQKIAQRHGIPYMSFLVGSPWDVLIHHRRLLAKIMAPISLFTTRRMLKNSDYAHYVTRQYLQEKYPTKGKSLGCSDINLGKIDMEAFHRRMEKRKSKTAQSEIRLMTVGSIDAGYKGQEYVMKAMVKLKEKGDHRYHYYLIGGQKGERLRRIAKELGIEEQVHFLGVKTINEVFSYLDDCDIYLQPSLTEGLPRSVIEAMSRAMPCIGFQTGGIPELLETKYIVKQKDVEGIIRSLHSLDDEEEYKRAAERNFKEALTYDHEILQKQIRDFFIEIKKDIENKQHKANELD